MPGLQPSLHSEKRFSPGAHNGPDVRNPNSAAAAFGVC